MTRQLGDEARRPPRGARRGRPRVAAPARAGRRLRQVPRARHLPDPRPERPRRRARRPARSRATGPKYLNSPATPLFDKSRTLYLIDKAKGPIRKIGQAVIVEGYTDALMAHQAGFDNVVAASARRSRRARSRCSPATRTGSPSPTTSTRPARRPGTLGVTALAALIGQLQAPTLGVKLDDVRVVRLPDGKDPDEVVRETPDRWREAVADGQADRRVPDRPPRRPVRPQDAAAARLGFVEAVMPTLRDDRRTRCCATRRSRRVHRVSGRRGASSSARSSTGGSAAAAGSDAADRGRITADAVLASPDALPVGDILRAITPVEAELLRLLLLVPEQQLRVVDELGPDQLPEHRRPRAVPGDRPPARPERPGHPPAVRRCRRSWPASTTRPRASAQALLAQAGPDPRASPSERLAYEVDRCLLELEDEQLASAATTSTAAQAEAERPRRPRRRSTGSLERSARSTRAAGRSTGRSNNATVAGTTQTRLARHAATGGRPMPADPLDKQLVEAVLSRPRRAKADLEEAKLAGLRPSRAAKVALPNVDDDEDDDDDDLDLGPTAPPTTAADVGHRGRRRRRRRGGRSQAAARRAGQARPEGGRGADRRGARGHLRRHDRDRRPGPDVPQGDRQGRAADRRGRGRPGQGDRARRAAGRGAVEGRSSRSTSGRSTTPSARPGPPKPQHRLPFGDEAHADGPRRRSRTRAPPTCSSPTPDFHLIKAGRDAQSDGTKELLKEAKKLVAAYNETLDPETFLTLLDWAYFAVHNGDLDSRDNVGLRAI